MSNTNDAGKGDKHATRVVANAWFNSSYWDNRKSKQQTTQIHGKEKDKGKEGDAPCLVM